MTDKKQKKYSTQSYSTVSPYTSVAGVTFIEKDGDAVAEVYGADEDGRALATLFASAPEMLEILKELLDGGLTLIRDVGLRNKMFDIVAKAKGSE